MLKTKVALAGNRTPVSRVAGENSTTEPPMLVKSLIYPAQSHIKYCNHVKNKSSIGGDSNPRLPRTSREFSTDPPMLVTSPIYHAQVHIKYCIHVKNKCCVGQGIEPRSPTWQARILPLNHQCWNRQEFSLHNHIYNIAFMLKIIVALTGNRATNSPVADGNSTTEPPMPVITTIYPAQSHIKYCIHVKNKSCIGGESNPVSRVAGENSTTEPPILVT